MRFFPEESAELPLKLTRYNVIRKLFSYSFVSELIFIVDDAIRDNTTATYLIKGLDAWNRSSFEVHGEVWSPEAFFDKCADLLPSPDILANNLEENIKKMDAPEQKLWDKLQAVSYDNDNCTLTLTCLTLKVKPLAIFNWMKTFQENLVVFSFPPLHISL